MSFKLLYTNLAGPMGDINVSAGLVAEAGMIGVISGNSSTGDPEVILATSGTTGLVGIIDDNKTTSFSATVVNEVVASGQTALSLNNANIVAASDSAVLASPSGTITLSSRVNGTIVVTGMAPSTTTTVSYSYVIPGKAGDDTTLASGKCTIWLQEGEYSTDVYELSNGVLLSTYTVGAPLYVADTLYGQQGRLTSRVGQLKVARVTKAPTAGNSFMELLSQDTAFTSLFYLIIYTVNSIVRLAENANFFESSCSCSTFKRSAD